MQPAYAKGKVTFTPNKELFSMKNERTILRLYLTSWSQYYKTKFVEICSNLWKVFFVVQSVILMHTSKKNNPVIQK
jgi:hypothetical protein